MVVDYGIDAEQCPNTECYANDYESYVGQTVRIGGTVVDTSPVTIETEYGSNESLRLKLAGFDRSVTEGAGVSVYGTFEPDFTVQVQDSTVHPPANKRYMYGISFLALLFVTALGLRYWRFDTEQLVFVRRDR